MPHSGGYIVWVHNAFGPALALLNGMVNLLCNVFDCALYPLLLAQYVERALYPLLPPEPHGAHGASWWRELAPDVIGSCLRLAVVALAAGVNVLGTSVVGIGMVAFMFLVSPPLLALVLASYAAPHTAPLAPFTPSLQEPPTTAAQWHFLLALVMWNNCGYVSAGMVASFGRQVLTTALRPLHTGTTRRAWSPPRSRTLRVPSLTIALGPLLLNILHATFVTAKWACCAPSAGSGDGSAAHTSRTARTAAPQPRQPLPRDRAQ